LAGGKSVLIIYTIQNNNNCFKREENPLTFFNKENDMTNSRFEELPVWQEAIKLAEYFIDQQEEKWKQK
jgi:hypothetical protein